MAFLRPGAGPVRRLFCWGAGVSAKKELLVARSDMDRLLAKREQQRIWELTPGAIDMDITIARSAMELAGRKKCQNQIKLRAWALAHRIIKETFIDRTIAAVHRIDVRQQAAVLPRSDSEQPKQDQNSIPAPIEAAAVAEALRQMRERAQSQANGGPVH